MDLVKKIKRTWKVSSVVILLLMFASCFKKSGSSSDFENLIKDSCIQVDTTYEIKLKDNIKHDYDKLYIFEGPRFPSEIEEITSIKYDDVLDDGDRLYLFVKNKTIIKQETSSCKDVNIHRIVNKQGYAVFSPETIVFAKKRKNGEDFYYDVFYK